MKIHYKLLLVLVALIGTIPFSFSQRGGASNPVISIQADIHHLTDEITAGEIDYEVVISTGWTRRTRINSLKLKDSNGDLVYTHSGSGPLGLAQGLAIGYYDFTGSITVQNSSGYYISMPINQRIWIGREAMWCDSKDMNVAFDNTISRELSTITYAGGRSNNIVQEGDGWIQLNGKYGNGSNSRSYLVLGNTQDISSFSPNAQQQFIEFYSTSSGGGIRIKYKTAGGSYLYSTISNNPSDAVRLIRQGTTVSVQIRSNSYASFIFPTSYNGALNIGVFANEVGDGFKNVITSMPGGSALASWDEDLNTGIINVDISSLGIAGPYNYFISDENENIPDFQYLGSFIENSMGLEIGNHFYDGSNPSSTFSQLGLSNGSYVIVAYDNSGNKVFTKTMNVHPEFEFESNQNLVVNGDIVAAPNGTAYGTFELYSKSTKNAISFIQIKANSRDLYYGVNASNVNVSNVSQIKYGFQVQSGKIYSILDGEKLGAGYPFGEDIEIGIETGNNQIGLVKSYGSTEYFAIPSETEFQLSLGLNYKARISKGDSDFEFKTYNVRSNIIRYLNCEEDETASFSFSVSMPGESSVSMNYNVKDEDGNVLLSNEPGFTQYSYVVNTSTVGQPLTAGVYTVYGFVTGGGSFSQDIYLGYETLWHIREDYYVETPNTYSVEVQNSPETDYSLARSENILKFNEEGWVEFTAVTDANNGPNIFRFTTLNINGTPNQGGLLNEDFILVTTNSTGNGAVITPYSSQSGWQTPIYTSKNARVRLMFKTNISGSAPYGTIEVYVYNQLKRSFNRGNSSIISRVNSMKNSDGFKDIVSSFGCLPKIPTYAHLKYEMDGYYHIMKEGIINFIFDQEYDTYNLEFKIYNELGFVVKTNGDFPPLNATNGVNYFSIDISDNTQCIGQGFFYLVVTNSKKEKSYLRFFNDYTGCQTDDTINEGNHESN